MTACRTEPSAWLALTLTCKGRWTPSHASPRLSPTMNRTNRSESRVMSVCCQLKRIIFRKLRVVLRNPAYDLRTSLDCRRKFFANHPLTNLARFNR